MPKYYTCDDVAQANDILAAYDEDTSVALSALLAQAEFTGKQEEDHSVTLYFSAPSALLEILLGKSFLGLHVDRALFSLEFPRGQQEANTTYVMVSPADKNGMAYNWQNINLHASDIEKLFNISNRSQSAYVLEYFETYSRTYEIKATSRAEAEEKLIHNIQNGNTNAPEECVDAGFIEEASLIDGNTSCCGYDFGTDLTSANFCPVCGKRLLKG